ncbi:FKBP-type peptidyl-prolyl cis-trans isomerase [Ekhidna sp.]|uniref:FKBP-type peptidyl-prolyl cis-trans isomerase n=1 Tax=Ekhidna sp. TaxID=2608089 RepID=UPI003CCBBF15
MKKILILSSVFVLLFTVSCKDDETTLTEEQQLAADIELIDSYLASNNIDAQIHESEIRYVVEKEGDGESPTAESSVIVKYQGRLLDGTIFDLNTLGIHFDLSLLIESWKLILPEIKEGGKVTLYTPSKYGYGRNGNGLIPPNTVLIFEIELVSLVRPEGQQWAIDIAKIDEYLESNNITAEVHQSGIRYQVIEEGTGISPTLSDLITVNFVGSFLDNDEVFDEGSNEGFRLNNMIDAWQTMVPTMKEGGKIIIYAPSEYCFGNIGNKINIPPNAILIFEIELLNVRS